MVSANSRVMVYFCNKRAKCNMAAGKTSFSLYVLLWHCDLWHKVKIITEMRCLAWLRDPACLKWDWEEEAGVIFPGSPEGASGAAVCDEPLLRSFQILWRCIKQFWGNKEISMKGIYLRSLYCKIQKRNANTIHSISYSILTDWIWVWCISDIQCRFFKKKV